VDCARGLLFVLLASCASATPSNDGGLDGSADAGGRDFTCAGTWVCTASDAGTLTLKLTSDPRGCLLMGLTPETVLASGGSLVQGARTVGSASGTGDSASFSIDGARYTCRGATESTRGCAPGCGM